MSYQVINPFPQFVDPANGNPLSGGSLYFGRMDSDPKNQPANRINVYAVQDNGTEVLLSQPIQLNGAGQPQYSGSVKQLKVEAYSNEDAYAIQVFNRRGSQKSYTPRVYLALDASSGVSKAALASTESTIDISGVTAKSVAIHVKQARRNISHYISRAQLDDALTGNPQLDTTTGWNNALQDTTITALDFKGGYKVSGTGAACITQTANVSLFGNSRRDSFIRADAAGAFTSIISLQIATNGGLGDVRGWQAKDFVIFHNGGGGSCITNDGGLPMLECAFENIGFQAGSTAGVRDLVMTRFAFSKVEQCSFGSGVTCGLTAHPSPDGNKFLLNNFFGIPTALILEIESGAYRTEVYGGTMVSRDGGVRILKGSQVAIRGVQFEQFQPYGPNVSPESAHIAVVGSASQISDSIIVEGNNFGGGTNLQNLIYTDYASNVDISRNVMNAPNPTGFDVFITANSKYVKPRTDNVIQGNISNPRPQNVRFPMVVSDSGVGTYNVLKDQTTLLNGWTGGQFYKDETDKVIINTGFNSGSLAVSTAICTMPEGFKPADFYALPAVSSAGFCVVNANPTTGQLLVGANTSASNSEFASNLTFASRRGA